MKKLSTPTKPRLALDVTVIRALRTDELDRRVHAGAARTSGISVILTCVTTSTVCP